MKKAIGVRINRAWKNANLLIYCSRFFESVCDIYFCHSSLITFYCAPTHESELFLTAFVCIRFCLVGSLDRLSIQLNSFLLPSIWKKWVGKSFNATYRKADIEPWKTSIIYFKTFVEYIQQRKLKEEQVENVKKNYGKWKYENVFSLLFHKFMLIHFL